MKMMTYCVLLEVFNVHSEELSDDDDSNDDNVGTTAPPFSEKSKERKTT